jgi:hypothetical protein
MLILAIPFPSSTIETLCEGEVGFADCESDVIGCQVLGKQHAPEPSVMAG